jgi:hypothetical protein
VQVFLLDRPKFISENLAEGAINGANRVFITILYCIIDKFIIKYDYGIRLGPNLK